MEKLEKKKHDHKLTKWIKFGIFAIIMLAPFFSVLARTMYVVVNKNAKDSYSLQQGTTSIYTGEQDSILLDQYYIFNTNLNLTLNENNRLINVKEFSTISGNWSQWSNKTIKIINFQNYHNENGWFIHLENEQHNHYYIQYASSDGTTVTQNLTFTFKSNINLEINPYKNFIELITFARNEYLDNAFEYSINKLKEDNLYNWSTQTGIYTAINNMINGLGANDVLAMLLAYWGILTAIYFVFDIVIECFTKLTHLIAD